jgi:hypothetical protein
MARIERHCRQDQRHVSEGFLHKSPLGADAIQLILLPELFPHKLLTPRGYRARNYIYGHWVTDQGRKTALSLVAPRAAVATSTGKPGLAYAVTVGLFTRNIIFDRMCRRRCQEKGCCYQGKKQECSTHRVTPLALEQTKAAVYQRIGSWHVADIRGGPAQGLLLTRSGHGVTKRSERLCLKSLTVRGLPGASALVGAPVASIFV